MKCSCAFCCDPLNLGYFGLLLGLKAEFILNILFSFVDIQVKPGTNTHHEVMYDVCISVIALQSNGTLKLGSFGQLNVQYADFAEHTLSKLCIYSRETWQKYYEV